MKIMYTAIAHWFFIVSHWKRKMLEHYNNCYTLRISTRRFFFFITDFPLHLSKIISLKKGMKSTQFFERTLTYADIYRYWINNLKEKTIAPNIFLLSWMHSQLKHTESTRKQSYADNDVITPFVSLSFRRFVYQVSLFYQSFKL